MGRGRHVGQRAGLRVGLAPGARDVVGEAVEAHGRGAEAIVGPHVPAERGSDLRRVALDDEIEIERPPIEQQVPNGAAYQVHRDRVGQMVEERRRGRQRAHLSQQLMRRRDVHERQAWPIERLVSPRKAIASITRMPSPGPRRWLRWVLVAVGVVLLLAAGAVAAIILHSPGNVSHPNVEFTAPTTTTTTSTATAPKRKKAVDNFQWPRYGYDVARTRDFPNSSRLDPPLHRGWNYNDGALLEFPPVIYQNTLYLIDDNGSAQADQQAQRPRDLEAQGRDARRRVDRRSTPATTSCSCRCFRHTRRQPGRRPLPGALDEDRARGLDPHRRGGHRDLADGRRQRGVLRRPGGNRRLAEDHRRPRELGLPRQRRGQGRPGVSPTASCTSATTAATPTRSTPTAATRCGVSAPTARISASARATSTRPRRSRSAACTWATPTGACTRSPRARASSRGRPATGAYVYASPAVAETPRASARRCTSAPTTATSTRSTRGRARSAGRTRPAAGSPARPTIVGNVVYYSNLGTKTTAGLDVAHRPEGVRVLRRRVQPGDRRPQRDLPGRLRRASTSSCPSPPRPLPTAGDRQRPQAARGQPTCAQQAAK